MTSFRFRLKGGYVIGAISFPTDVGNVTVGSVGGSKAEALMRAATIAQRIAEDPVLSALLPPQAANAIKAAKALSVAAKRGPKALRGLWGKLKGAGKKRLAAALHAEVGAYGYERSGVQQPNRGAWMRALDPYYDDEDGYDDDAEGFDDEGSDEESDNGFDLSDIGRRKRRRKRRGKAGNRARARKPDPRPEPEPELPPDNEPASVPQYEPQQYEESDEESEEDYQ